MGFGRRMMVRPQATSARVLQIQEETCSFLLHSPIVKRFSVFLLAAAFSSSEDIVDLDNARRESFTRE